MGAAIQIPVSGGVAAQVLGATPLIESDGNGSFGVQTFHIRPIQLVGFIPLYDCDSEDCRAHCDRLEYVNPVFGVLKGGGSYESGKTYENDWNTFLLDLSLFGSAQNISTAFSLQKWFGGAWRDAPFGIDLTSNAFGTLYAPGDYPGHPTYSGYHVNWGAILFHAGPGCYRFKAVTTYPDSDDGFEDCKISPPFKLLEWNCRRAHGTVKFETYITGMIGDPYQDYFLHNLCGFFHYDSIRLKGFFGKQKSPEYKTENVEWGEPQHGRIEHVRDEQIQRWEFNSKLLPEYILIRQSTFKMMSDYTFISDYNLNNSDYTIKQRNMIKDSGYEPEWLDKEAYWSRRDKATVQLFFKRGVQSVIKTLCCPPPDAG